MNEYLNINKFNFTSIIKYKEIKGSITKINNQNNLH